MHIFMVRCEQLRACFLIEKVLSRAEKKTHLSNSFFIVTFRTYNKYKYIYFLKNNRITIRVYKT